MVQVSRMLSKSGLSLIVKKGEEWGHCLPKQWGWLQGVWERVCLTVCQGRCSRGMARELHLEGLRDWVFCRQILLRIPEWRSVLWGSWLLWVCRWGEFAYGWGWEGWPGARLYQTPIQCLVEVLQLLSGPLRSGDKGNLKGKLRLLLYRTFWWSHVGRVEPVGRYEE